MFRKFCISSKELLIPRPLPALTFLQESSAPGSLANIRVYDVRRNKHATETKRALLPLSRPLRAYPMGFGGTGIHLTGQGIRWASEARSFQIPDPATIACNLINMLKCVDLKDLKEAPPPAFWTSVGLGGLQLVLPFLEIIGGYSPVMTLLQLHAAAISLAFFGGNKWGLAVSSNPIPTPTWEGMRWALLPPGVALIGLALPYPLGFITIGSGMVASLYLDLKSCAYPPWALAMALFVTLTTVTGLFLALSAYVLFHNRDKKNQEKEALAKEKEKEKEDEDDG